MDDALSARLRDLDRTAFSKDITKAGRFLSAAEVSEALSLMPSFSSPGAMLTGGYPEAERKRLLFPASYEGEEVEKDFVTCIRVSPLNEKFAEELSHRDVLGALMSLGIGRDCIGDIRCEGKKAWIYAAKEMEEVIVAELKRIRHTEVKAEAVSLTEGAGTVKIREEAVNVASERLDGVIAAVFKLSRSEALGLIREEKVFLDGKVASSSGCRLSEGMRISVRGMGKFIYEGIGGESRKGRLYVRIGRYV